MISGAFRSSVVVFLAALALTATRPAAAQPVTKRPLTHQDYDAWRSIQGPTLSRDGKFLAYALVPQDGDGEFVVRNLATGGTWRASRGSRVESASPPTTGPRPGRAGRTAGTGSRTAFTADGRAVLFSIAPTKAEINQAKKARKKPEEMPRNALGIMDLATGHVTRIERVRDFQVPEEGAGFIAYHRELPPEARRTERRPDDPPATTPATNPAGRQRRPPRPEQGSDLVLRDLAKGTERVFSDVLDYSFSKDGKLLIYTVASKKPETNGVYVVSPGSPASPLPLLAGKGKYTRPVWDEKQTQLAFLSSHDDAAAAQPAFKLYRWSRKPGVITAQTWPASLGLLLVAGLPFTGPNALSLTPSALQPMLAAPAEALVSAATPGFRSGWIISDKGSIQFSQDGGKLFFGLARPSTAPKQTDTPAEDRVVVDLWHWKDDFIQPMQKIRAEQERNRTYRAVYHLKEKRFQQLADETMTEATPCNDGRWALGTDDRSYRHLVGYDGNYTDSFLIDTLTGFRKAILKRHAWGLTWSPKGKYLLFFDGKNWNTFRTADRKITNLTKSIGLNFGIEDFDVPSPAPAYGTGGWTADESGVLIYDRYDVWQITADGSKAHNLTRGRGRKEKVQFRYVRLDPQEKALDPARPLLLRAENELTHDSGYYRVRLGGAPLERLLMGPKNYGYPIKAKNADVLVLTASTFADFPDLYVTNSSFQNLRRVTDANPQKAQFLWGRAELIQYKNLNGVPLRGILIKPENFDPAKKYPLMVYIYEKLSQNLHHFVDPRPGTSINPSYYASNGYLVLMPDIVYTVGYPGQSALKCVLPAIQAVVDEGYVNENAIGIQGHSWGGYQIAYMITQTNRFKAVAAGAPVANMTSAYSGIRWGSGLPRQFQYERTQSRIGGNLWQYPLRFVENSPVFMADRVQTPILMLHNDQDDAVPWYQGIEYFLALRRLGKEAYLFNYNGEPHGLRKRVNQKDYTVRMQQYFDHYLKGAPKPEWMVKGIPYLSTHPR
jgi:dipeptidyl aminopeptidase/acylaminoacyl peptidase